MAPSMHVEHEMLSSLVYACKISDIDSAAFIIHRMKEYFGSDTVGLANLLNTLDTELPHPYEPGVIFTKQIGNSVLHYVANSSSKTSEAISDLILFLGGDPTIPNLSGFTPLHVACKMGNVGTLKSILMNSRVSANILRDLIAGILSPSFDVTVHLGKSPSQFQRITQIQSENQSSGNVEYVDIDSPFLLACLSHRWLIVDCLMKLCQPLPIISLIRQLSQTIIAELSVNTLSLSHFLSSSPSLSIDVEEETSSATTQVTAMNSCRKVIEMLLDKSHWSILVNLLPYTTEDIIELCSLCGYTFPSWLNWDDASPSDRTVFLLYMHVLSGGRVSQSTVIHLLFRRLQVHPRLAMESTDIALMIATASSWNDWDSSLSLMASTTADTYTNMFMDQVKEVELPIAAATSAAPLVNRPRSRSATSFNFNTQVHHNQPTSGGFNGNYDPATNSYNMESSNDSLTSSSGRSNPLTSVFSLHSILDMYSQDEDLCVVRELLEAGVAVDKEVMHEFGERGIAWVCLLFSDMIDPTAGASTVSSPPVGGVGVGVGSDSSSVSSFAPLTIGGSSHSHSLPYQGLNNYSNNHTNNHNHTQKHNLKNLNNNPNTNTNTRPNTHTSPHNNNNNLHHDDISNLPVIEGLDSNFPQDGLSDEDISDDESNSIKKGRSLTNYHENPDSSPISDHVKQNRSVSHQSRFTRTSTFSTSSSLSYGVPSINYTLREVNSRGDSDGDGEGEGDYRGNSHQSKQHVPVSSYSNTNISSLNPLHTHTLPTNLSSTSPSHTHPHTSHSFATVSVEGEGDGEGEGEGNHNSISSFPPSISSTSVSSPFIRSSSLPSLPSLPSLHTTNFINSKHSSVSLHSHKQSRDETRKFQASLSHILLCTSDVVVQLVEGAISGGHLDLAHLLVECVVRVCVHCRGIDSNKVLRHLMSQVYTRNTKLYFFIIDLLIDSQVLLTDSVISSVDNWCMNPQLAQRLCLALTKITPRSISAFDINGVNGVNIVSVLFENIGRWLDVTTLCTLITKCKQREMATYITSDLLLYFSPSSLSQALVTSCLCCHSRITARLLNLGISVGDSGMITMLVWTMLMESPNNPLMWENLGMLTTSGVDLHRLKWLSWDITDDNQIIPVTSLQLVSKSEQLPSLPDSVRKGGWLSAVDLCQWKVIGSIYNTERSRNEENIISIKRVKNCYPTIVQLAKLGCSISDSPQGRAYIYRMVVEKNVMAEAALAHLSPLFVDQDNMTVIHRLFDEFEQLEHADDGDPELQLDFFLNDLLSALSVRSDISTITFSKGSRKKGFWGSLGGKAFGWFKRE